MVDGVALLDIRVEAENHAFPFKVLNPQKSNIEQRFRLSIKSFNKDGRGA
jgi:hypothetical protein